MAGEDAAETKAKAEGAKITAPKVKVKDPQAIIDSAAAARGETVVEPAGVEGDKKEKEKVIKKLSPGCARPVMIHRAMAGSIERFTGILCEHYAGKWPLWLSPRQILVVPVGKGFYDYAEKVRSIFKKAKMFVDVDTSGNVSILCSVMRSVASMTS